MVREILKLKTDNGLGANNPTFKDIEITEYSFKSPRMGMPTLTATLMWPTCLDDEWTDKEYVVLRGEKYYVHGTPSSEKNNTDSRYKHSLEFKSEREQLGKVYFYDVVPSFSATYDRPNTNSTEFKFFGTIREYADRLNCAFRYTGIGDSILNTKTSLTDLDTPAGDGYCVVVSGYGEGDLTASVEMSFSDQWLWDALVEGYNKYGIPFSFRGKKIIFNEYVEFPDHVFKYGYDNSLLSVKKNNANAKIINRITFKGSSENIPYYYPNETEYGHVSLAALPTNKVLTLSDFTLEKPERLVGLVPSGAKVMLNVSRRISPLISSIKYYELGQLKNLALGQWYVYEMGDKTVQYVIYAYRLTFTIGKSGTAVISHITGQLWNSDKTYTGNKVADAIIGPDTKPDNPENILNSEQFTFRSLSDSSGNDYTANVSVGGGQLSMADLQAGSYILEFEMTWKASKHTYWKITSIGTTGQMTENYYWAANGERVGSLAKIGVSLSSEITDAMIGDGFSWTGSGRMPFQTNLMPPKYRDTLGAKRFYNALNNTYPDGADGYLSFPNPYVDGNPSEHIHVDESIKPTIEGVKNSSGKLFGALADVAFDSDDNDSLKAVSDTDSASKGSADYEHSFFYIKLNKFDGTYGFNLFDSASQTDPMTIQMTSGKCNGCKFKIQAFKTEADGAEIWKNPVQAQSPDGNIAPGVQSDKIKTDNLQDFQQDTSKNSIWIAVQKDADTFGVIMPNRSHGYMPEPGDTFNIINIDLPQGYIAAAEKRGEEAMLRFMADNNEEKFNFDITASRIFFAENKELLASLDENSRIRIEYNGHIYEQYVSEFGIDCKDGEALPDVRMSLADTLTTGSSFVEEVAAKASDLSGGQTGGTGGGGSQGGLTTALADARYMRKDKNERTPHRISTDNAFEVGSFVSGSSGGIFFVDPETGQSTIEADNLKIRMKAVFETLEIAHVRSIGGKLIISPGGSVVISFVEEMADSYRCYFKQQEEEEGADCRFIVGDDVYCQSFNVTAGTLHNASNNYYWRAVTAVSNDGSYIELSKTDCATGSDIPQIGDTVCQLGSDVPDRQSAIVLSTVDAFSPNVTLYDGITNFTLSGKEMVDYGVDQSTKKAYFHVYGNSYIGDKEGQSYVKYDNLLKKMEIKAMLSIQSTVGDDSLEEYIKKVSPPVKQEDIEDFVNNIVNPKLEGIQNQIDGVIESFFGFGAPTLNNYPANEWTTDEARKAHANDTYTDKTEYVDDVTTPTAGMSWRWQYTSPTDYGWVKIADSDAVKALLDAAKAQDTADGKRRTFTAIPTPPYDKGDLWVNATYPAGNTVKDAASGKYVNDILRCNTSRATGSFAIGDWGLASNYTDDTLAQDAINKIDGYEYLKKALGDVTTIAGGLMLSSQIRLGEHNEDFTTQTTWSGMNGVYGGPRTIAVWYGGNMIDRFDAFDVLISPAPANAAAALLRMDGTGYFAKGNIMWRSDGSGSVAGGKLTWDAAGNVTIGAGITVSDGSTSKTLAQVLNYINNLNSLLVPEDVNGNEISWENASSAVRIKAKKNFYSTGDITALGPGGSSSGGGGGGGTTYDRLDSWADYTSDKDEWVLSAGLGHGLYTRIGALESGGSLSAFNLVQSGSGNAVTALSLSSDKKTLTVTKGDIGYLHINDVRGAERLPSYYGEKRLTTWFNMYGTPSATWFSGIHMKGWTSGYASWELAANSSDVVGNTSLYFRVGMDATWQPWQRVLTNTNASSVLGEEFVTRSTAQTISGVKTFTGEQKFMASGLSYSDPWAGTACAVKVTGKVGVTDSIKALSFIKSGGTASQFLMADGSVGDELLYLRSRGATATNGDDTLWSQIGLKSYYGALPDGLSGVYDYGEAISFACNTARFDMYVNHHSSDGAHNGKGIYYRSGWDTDKRSWQLLLDTINYTSILDTRYVKKAGDTMTGKLTISNSGGGNQLTVNNTAGGESYFWLQSNSINKGALTTMQPSYGTCIYDATSSRYLGIKTNGTPHFQGNTLWHAGNDGSGSGLDADLLDGQHDSAFLRRRDGTSVDQDPTLWSQIGIKEYRGALPDGLTGVYSWGSVISLPSNGPRFDIYCSHYSSSNGLYFRSGYNDDKKEWVRLATVNDNVASATKLATARTLWGQSFDGTANVDGTIHIRPSTSSYTEGLRIHQSTEGNWAAIVLCGKDNTGNSGTSNGTWGIFNNPNYDLFINRGNSGSHTGYEFCNIGGNWGIGTILPQYKLDVNGTLHASDNAAFGADVSVYGNLRLKNSGNYGNAINFGDGEYVYIAEQTDDVMTINATGGIVMSTGTNTVSGTFTGNLHGNSSTATTLQTARTINGTSFDGSSNIVTSYWGTSRNFRIQDPSTYSNGPWSSVNGSGDVTIRIPTSINGLVEVNSTDIYASNSVQAFNGIVSRTSSYGGLWIYGGTQYYLARIHAFGSSPGWSENERWLDVNNDRTTRFYHSVRSDGDLTALSDIRLKNILRHFTIPVESVAAAPSFIHTWKKGEQGEFAGTSAQYWREVIPQVVRVSDTLTMDYGKAALLSAISIAKKTVDLENRVRNLETEVKELRRQLSIG